MHVRYTTVLLHIAQDLRHSMLIDFMKYRDNIAVLEMLA